MRGPEFSSWLERHRVTQEKVKRKLVRLGTGAVPALIARLGETDTGDWTVGKILRRIGKPGLAAIQQVFERESPARRAAAVNALWDFEEDAAIAVPWILQRLDDADPNVRWRLVHALGRIGPRAAEASPRLVELTGAPHPRVRSSAIFALERIDYDREVLAQICIDALNSDDTEARGMALSALTRVQCDPSPVLGRLVELLADPGADGLVERNVIELICRCQSAGSEAVGSLRNLLHDRPRSWRVRSEVAKAIWRLTGNADLVVPALVEMLSDDPEQRQDLASEIPFVSQIASEVCDAVSLVGPLAAPAVPALIRLLENSENQDICWAAVDALGSIGPAASAAISILKKKTRHSNELVRERAGIAIRRIRGESFDEN
jgi:HEAT repeat protein